MSLIYELENRVPVNSLSSRAAARLEAFLVGVRRYFAVRRTRLALEELPDAILRDIGISRGEIYSLSSAVHEPGHERADHSWRASS